MSGESVGVVGLGVMGSAMAANLIAAGLEVHGFDIDPERTQRFGAGGGHDCGSASEVAQRSSVVIFSLASVEALESVSSEIAEAGELDVVCVETGTLPLDAKLAARDRLAASGVTLLDAPLSGTGLQAADASLVIFASGPKEAYEQATVVFDVIGRQTYHLGEFGNGSVMKYIANLLVAIHNLATAEAHALGAAAGVDSAVVQEVMSAGFGSSKVFDIRGPLMVEDRYEPPTARLDIALKDARIIAEYARSVGLETPLLDASLPVYEASSAAGLGHVDPAILYRFFLDRDDAVRRVVE